MAQNGQNFNKTRDKQKSIDRNRKGTSAPGGAKVSADGKHDSM
jgi:hypothetical protein